MPSTLHLEPAPPATLMTAAHVETPPVPCPPRLAPRWRVAFRTAWRFLCHWLVAPTERRPVMSALDRLTQEHPRTALLLLSML